MSSLQYNPFYYTKPVRPEDFIGRKDILNRIYSLISGGVSVSLRAERRIGLTSILRYLSSDIALERLPDNYVLIYFDFQGLSAKASHAEVWKEILEAVTQEIIRRYPGRKEVILENSKTQEGLALNDNISGALISRYFRLLSSLGLVLVFLFDEFDKVASLTNLGNEFFDVLRSLPTQTNNIAYIIASRRGLSYLQKSHEAISSPFFNIFCAFHLQSFHEEEVHELISKYFDHSMINHSLAEEFFKNTAFLQEMTGYHPFFLQMLCYHTYSKANLLGLLNEAVISEAIKDFYRDAIPHFEYYWKVSSKEEQSIMLALAKGWQFEKDRRNRSILESLHDRSLLIPDTNSHSGFRLFSCLFSEWCCSENDSLNNDHAELSDSNIIDVTSKEERQAHLRRLRLLKVRAALQGIHTPPEVVIEIEDIERILKKDRGT